MRAQQIAEAVRQSVVIIDAVCEVTGYTVAEIKGPSRSTGVSRARQLAFYVVRERTRLSFPSVGEIFNRDHSTVMYGHRVVTKRLEDDEDFRDQHSKVTARIAKNVSRETIGGNDGERAT